MGVGVVLVPQDFTGESRGEQRLMLALGAYGLGVFLLDLLDVPAWAVDPVRAWAPVWELVARADAVAVIVFGGAGLQVPRPPGRLRGLAVHVLSPQGR
jgi:hypothetical protein